MEFPDGKYAWMVKIGEKGQFVIPKEARDLFDLQPGNEILVLGDTKRGLAILPKESYIGGSARADYPGTDGVVLFLSQYAGKNRSNRSNIYCL